MARRQARVRRVGAFAHVTGVSSCRLGLSMTLLDDRIYPTDNKNPVRSMGHIESLSLEELLSWTESTQAIERSIGIAAVNSCLDLAAHRYFAGNALDFIARRAAGKNVVVVGHFPHTDPIRQSAKSFKVLERRPQADDLPAAEFINVVPEADILAMTGVTCLNDTMEELLAHKRPDAICVALGPTAPLSPALFAAGVDVIGSAWIEDLPDVWSMLAQGGTARTLRHFHPVLMPRDPSWLAGWPEAFPPPDDPDALASGSEHRPCATAVRSSGSPCSAD